MGDGLEVQLHELRSLIAAQAREIASLRAEVRRAELGRTDITDANLAPGQRAAAVPAPAPTLSRRAFARLGAMAGVGAAATVAALGADSSPAAAAEGSAVLLGKDNGGATARTGIFASGRGLFATLADPQVGVGDQPFSAGVVAKGTVGVLGAGSGENGAGLYATDGVINGSASDGSGLCAGVQVWLQGPANTSPAISAETDGVGQGLSVALTSASNQQPAIYIVNSGSGSGLFLSDSHGLNGVFGVNGAVRRPDGFGAGVIAHLANPNNLSPAVVAHTQGHGNALEAKAASGVAVSASSARGAAAQFSSPVAHLRLIPGPGDHPAEGQAGDLFVDAGAHLWYFRGPGGWVKLA